jgi:hypothetical protein
MRKILYLLFLLITFSCNKDLEKKLVEIYTVSAERANDTLQIESFEILDYKNVDLNYIQDIQINNLNYSIKLNEQIIENNKKNVLLYKNIITQTKNLIELNPTKKEKYLLDIENNQERLKLTELQIKKYEDENAITHQKRVLLKFDSEKNAEREFEIIKYIFKGTINNIKRLDTMELVLHPKFENKFIKNEIFTDYKAN